MTQEQEIRAWALLIAATMIPGKGHVPTYEKFAKQIEPLITEGWKENDPFPSTNSSRNQGLDPISVQ